MYFSEIMQPSLKTLQNKDDALQATPMVRNGTDFLSPFLTPTHFWGLMLVHVKTIQHTQV